MEEEYEYANEFGKQGRKNPRNIPKYSVYINHERFSRAIEKISETYAHAQLSGMFIRKSFPKFSHTLPREMPGSSQREMSSIRRHALQSSVSDRGCSYIPLPNLHGSKVQLVNKLGLLV